MKQLLNKIKMDENGFTMTELLVGTAISLILLGLVAGVMQTQTKTFQRQSQLGEMQANGRAAVDFVTRSVQNAGYNVSRGKRFLAASDHYVTMVFDDDNDGAIQNDEVMTYAVSNPEVTDNETFTISPYFDEDGDGTVTSTETRDYDISLGLGDPPFHFYRITPNNDDSDVLKSKVARNIDNVIIRFWDKDGDPLPNGVAVDSDGVPVPPYTIPDDELNDIRKVEMDIVTRSKDEDPNANFVNSGTYYSGSVATTGGSSSYNDSYHRETYTAISSPRNLVTSPWGKISLVASPTEVSCPDSSSTITASVVDGDGEGVHSGVTVNFNTSDGTVSPASNATVGAGNATTTLTYDWESPSVSATLSASALIDIDGEGYPVFNAIPVSFNSGNGIFTEDFDDGDSDGWTEEGDANWNVASQQYKSASNDKGLSSNGCASWKDYETSIQIKRNGSLGTGEYVGLVLRYQSYTQQYHARIYCTLCTGGPSTHQYVLELVDYSSGDTVLTSQSVTFDSGDFYTLKASVEDDTLNAKFWKTSETEPVDWDITATNASYTQGKIGIIVSTNTTTFDDVVVNPL
ncbi:MAG: prepilin-type N-terminal cleavage/methylation domain-containing protein [Nitrospina sp.]|jgi:prepilin-type N-terminal cleavage/methylation domain-containing protein|nr:prepilin-type N-terminal cleavage/methylation domain-containing protein [Nitrospina sp.]MBT6716553.1 prepilin-type N-terminal cleavage/methylation domain-containing protein [Nitrospina sp.]